MDMNQNPLNEAKPSWCIMHIPHGSVYIPDAERQKLLISEEELQLELIRITDWYVHDLFVIDDPRVKDVVFPYSRLLVDVERCADDEREKMAEQGLGAVYSRTISGKPLRKSLGTSERELLIKTYYQPYHRYMEESIKMALDVCGYCLILDCHSFPTVPFPQERNPDQSRPEICIGFDSFHASLELIAETRHICRSHFESLQFNQPFSGSFVPSEFYQSEKRVSSLMITINRGLYLQEETALKTADFSRVQSSLQQMVMELINAFEDITRSP